MEDQHKLTHDKERRQEYHIILKASCSNACHLILNHTPTHIRRNMVADVRRAEKYTNSAPASFQPPLTQKTGHVCK